MSPYNQPSLIHPLDSVVDKPYSASMSPCNAYTPPSSAHGGTVRAAAMAARQARQLRLRAQARQHQNGQVHASVALQARKPFHEKKHLNLHLNLDGVSKPELPAMLAIPAMNTGEHAAEPMPWAEMADDDEDEDGGGVVTTNSPSRSIGRRRQSSVVLSINSPEGAEFHEVAHDGPEQLGQHTKRVKRLGKGAGGTVYLSLYLPTLKLVAVKEVVVYKEQERHMVQHELHALHENLVPIDADPNERQGFWDRLTSIGKSTSPAACPYLVGFYGAYLLPAKCVISVVMEFMDMGSLQDILDAKITIPEPILRHCAFCCMMALEHMHRHRMIHRDIKPANVLINRSGQFKIADFGLAGTLSKSESFFSEFEGTMMYMAPERIQGQPYSYVSDVWSMGVSLFYLATGVYPFVVEDGFFGLEEAIVNDPMPPMPNRFSPTCRDFVKGLLRRDPNERMTAGQALAHPFLSGYEGSVEFARFPSLWEKMPLRSAIQVPDDLIAISELIVEQAQRRPHVVALDTLVRPRSAPSSPASDHASPTNRPKSAGLLSQFTGLFGRSQDRAGTLGRSSLDRLAEHCGVPAEELAGYIQHAVNKQLQH